MSISCFRTALAAGSEVPAQRISLLAFKYLVTPFISKQFAPRVRHLCKIPAFYLQRSVPLTEIKHSSVF